MISGQQLPKVDKTKEKAIVDPLVRVEIFGVRPDTAWLETSYVENNGEMGRAGGQWEEHISYFPTVLPCYTQSMAPPFLPPPPQEAVGNTTGIRGLDVSGLNPGSSLTSLSDLGKLLTH